MFLHDHNFLTYFLARVLKHLSSSLSLYFSGKNQPPVKSYSQCTTHQSDFLLQRGNWLMAPAVIIYTCITDLQPGHDFHKLLSAHAENSGNTNAGLLWWMNFILAKTVYNCAAVWETSHSTFLLFLTHSQGQTCTVVWRLLPHLPVPSSFSLTDWLFACISNPILTLDSHETSD